MEPFGLLNFLKSALAMGLNPQNQNNPDTAPQNAEENQPQENGSDFFSALSGFSGAPAPTPARGNTNNTNKKKDGNAQTPPPKNTCAEFIRRHDERAGRIRKK